MRRMHRNMKRVMILFVAAFLLLGSYFSYAVYFYGSRWFNSAYNPRIHQAKQEVIAGDLKDRGGVVLATSDASGKRVYAADKALRLSVSHVVGDATAYVAAGAETFHAGELLGFHQGLISRVQQTFFAGGRRGSDVTLTIDSRLHTYIASIFPSGKDGAVALIDYKTGEIYALYSTPAFDVNNIEQIKDQPGSSLVNRATQGQYAPGSIFKVITLAAALGSVPDLEAREFFCEGEREMGEFTITDNEGKGHAGLDIHRAFNISCNLTFAQLGTEIGQGQLLRTAEDFGFNDDFLFQDLMLYASVFPQETMTQGILAWTSVGQGELLVSPLHMAMVAGSIANGGAMMEPKMVSAVEGGRGQSSAVYKQCVSQATAQTLKSYMRACVLEGTASRGSFSGGTVCGKTGTAQTATSGQGVEPHSWFIGFNDDPERPLAVAVIIEKGGSGSQNAAPLAGNVMGKASKLIWGDY